MSIRHLAWEVISYIAHELDVDDLFNLSLSCRHFQCLIRDNNICKRVLQSAAPSSPETRSAHASKEYARALRLIFKRRTAISSASPYLAAVVADAESFVYANGVLCYISKGLLRIRDLHNSSPTESVIDLGKLLDTDQDLSRTIGGKQNYSLHILHYADGFVSCRYVPKDSPASWLLVINPSQGSVLSHSLASSRKIFVRNNNQFLYYGTHCHIAEDGSRRWALRGCNLLNGKWHGYLTHLPEMIGSEIGTNICFEIIDGYFYALANQALFEREEIRWTSYYTCVRFPVNQAKPKSTQLGTMKEIWRKFHSEGPIDDRWNFISLAKDERTETLAIVEGRREWRAGASASRTYYTSELQFPGETGSEPAASGHAVTSYAAGSLSPNTASFSSTDYSCSPEDTDDDQVPTSRSPHMVHPGDNAATLPLLTLNNSLLRCYHSSCQTYLDLVSHGDSDKRQGIRLRVGSRSLRSHSELGPPVISTEENPLYPEQQIERLYKSAEIKFWPPAHWTNDSRNGRDLYEILNPQTHKGDFTGMWDDRSMCYTTGGHTKTIVFISFDPSIRLAGIRPWFPGSQADKQGIDPRVATVGDNAAVGPEKHLNEFRHTSGPSSLRAPLRMPENSDEEQSRTDETTESSLVGISMLKETTSSKTPPPTDDGESKKPKWTWTTHPVHAGIHKGFHFAL
ncbi:hypothetical protein PpBr36_08367 [Pyricularia pennisetigena]|uniref:hypothetical protein n=1 Tax=Pyricularia pennisetigena TaxID=1578925 RepID=UPI00114E898B|nr:hypothetical protein PpBr36_08367 [Pyricularia pennisetigena]TLS24104.1 hypothetical protein PpBr36_08367 [Pyricularia pennisetigena]